MATRYAIWCTATEKGGEPKASWLKESKIVTCYASEKAAKEAAERLQTAMRRSAFHTGVYTYEAREYDET